MTHLHRGASYLTIRMYDSGIMKSRRTCATNVGTVTTGVFSIGLKSSIR
jgi:hypothetical protein